MLCGALFTEYKFEILYGDLVSEIFGIDTMRFDSYGILGEPIDDFVEHRLQDDSGGIKGVNEFLLVVVAKMECSKLMKLKGELF